MQQIATKWLAAAVLAATIVAYPTKAAIGQRSFLLTGGFGMPEMSNVGIRYLQGQVQVGASYGWFQAFGSQFQSVSITGQVHLFGSSEMSAQRPWFTRAGLCFLNEDTQEEEELHSLLNLQLGRALNLSQRWGVEVYLGYSIQVGSDKRIKDTSYWGITSNLEKSSFPSLGFNFYYRL